MQKGLISVLTPAYNTGSIIVRLLDSILIQDYHDIEMIVMDDGSSDNTKDIVQSYISKFLEKGYKLLYYYQTNSGQSAAICNGLKYVNGEFLVWPDSDDFYSDSSAFSEFVRVFNNQPHINIVRCLTKYLDEDRLIEVDRIEKSDRFLKMDLFEDCAFGRGAFFWGAGNYMIRMNAFDRCVSNRDIYVEKSAGQNWQLLVPMLYNQQCFTIPCYLFYILVRNSSHSRGQFIEYDKSLYIQDVYERTIINTIDRVQNMPTAEKFSLKTRLKMHYINKRMNIAIEYKRPSDAVRYMKELKAKGGTLSIFKQFYCRFCNNAIIILLYRLSQKIQSILRRI